MDKLKHTHRTGKTFKRISGHGTFKQKKAGVPEHYTHSGTSKKHK